MSAARRVLITGATGFVGNYLRAYLAAAYPAWQLTGTTLDHPTPDGAVVACDLRDAAAVADLVRRVQPGAIIHLAGQSNVPQSFAEPEETLSNNIIGTLHLLEACRAHAAGTRIVIVGSSEVYGPVPETEQPIGEDRPLRPGNPYAVSKAAVEMLALQYAGSYGLDVVVARPFNHIGPGQRGRFVVAEFAAQIVEVERGERTSISVGNLDAVRDFTDVRDVVRAYALLIEHGAGRGTYNLGGGAVTKIGDLLRMLCDMARAPVAVEQDPARMRPSDAPVMMADTSRLRAATGWQPEIPLEQSLRETLNWWRNELNAARHEGSGGGL